LEFFEYLTNNWDELIKQLLRHLQIIGIAIPISVGMAVPIGVLISYRKSLSKIVIGIAGIAMTIPSLALFGFMVILLAPFNAGIGIPPAVVAIVIYSLLPILRNTVVAVNEVSPGAIEAARGMGMTKTQILLRIRIKMGIPIIMAGVRNAAVMGVSVTTIAYLVGAQGLGYFLFQGLSRSRLGMVLVGAISVGLLGIGTNYGLMHLENLLTPKGLKIARKENK
jgi:osmoprotectant transport system permease protein